MDDKPTTVALKIIKDTKHKAKLVSPGTILEDQDPVYAAEFLETGVAVVYTDEMREADAKKGGKKAD